MDSRSRLDRLERHDGPHDGCPACRDRRRSRRVGHAEGADRTGALALGRSRARFAATSRNSWIGSRRLWWTRMRRPSPRREGCHTPEAVAEVQRELEAAVASDASA